MVNANGTVSDALVAQETEGGYLGTSSVLNAIRFKFTGSNISTGVITCQPLPY
jgi:hypothetical protein